MIECIMNAIYKNLCQKIIDLKNEMISSIKFLSPKRKSGVTSLLNLAMEQFLSCLFFFLGCLQSECNYPKCVFGEKAMQGSAHLAALWCRPQYTDQTVRLYLYVTSVSYFSQVNLTIIGSIYTQVSMYENRLDLPIIYQAGFIYF